MIGCFSKNHKAQTSPYKTEGAQASHNNAHPTLESTGTMSSCFASNPCVIHNSRFTNNPLAVTPLPRTITTSTTCQLSPREQERDEALKRQQEILARRRDKRKNRDYFNAVNERRRVLEEGIQSRRLHVVEGEDPLIAWKKLQAEGKIKEIGYEEVEGSIPMPMASFGIPRFDNGERFDLRLPHVEHGYTDEEADVMGKMARFFGFGKKKDKSEEEEGKGNGVGSS